MATPRYFAFEQRPGQEFFELTDPEITNKALKILSSEEKRSACHGQNRKKCQALQSEILVSSGSRQYQIPPDGN